MTESGAGPRASGAAWVDETLAALTLEEKLLLLSGRDVWHTNGVDRLGIPVVKLVDGPNGARGADGNHGPTSTSFPVGAAMGATWDPELMEEVGKALGEQADAKGASVLLGPTVNIPRVPNAGRNFECFSEDPLLSGLLAAGYVRGVQSTGVAACIKHFVCNDQETDRYTIDARVDERTLREVYLEPFRIAVAEAGPWSAMTAYNSVNGTSCAAHPMVDEVLRSEFGFDGLVVSDWYGTYGPDALEGGLDLEMPGPGRWLGAEAAADAVVDDRIDADAVDRRVRRLLTLIERTGAAQRSLDEAADERPEHRALARRAAAEAMVLLRNDGALPLGPVGSVAVIGDLAVHTPHQGGGSSSVNAHRVVSVLDGLRDAVGPGTEIRYEPGGRVRRSLPAMDPDCLVAPFTATYFAGAEPTGDPVRVAHTDRGYLAFFGTKDEWVSFDRFSVRVAGSFRARTTGEHHFRFAAIGRLRVRVDGVVVADGWSAPRLDGEQVFDWRIELSTGETIDLELEYGSVDDGTTWRFLGFGCEEPDDAPDPDRAVALAAEADLAVVVVGLTPEWEAEGFDRPDLRLPAGQDDLVAAVAAVQPNTVVVVTAGSPVVLPWAEDVRAILHAWYGGQEVGHAVADVLVGDVDPGGRLPVTFPATSRQHPGLLNHPGSGGRVTYGEGVHVGGRAFDKLGLRPSFPFCHGLSYADLAFGEVSVRQIDGGSEVLVEVVNEGSRNGTEVVQVFGLGIGGVERRLVGFAKVRVSAGESRSVRVGVRAEQLATWDVGLRSWSPPSDRPSFEVVTSFGRLQLPGS
jgi:beta-glucosidase